MPRDDHDHDHDLPGIAILAAEKRPWLIEKGSPIPVPSVLVDGMAPLAGATIGGVAGSECTEFLHEKRCLLWGGPFHWNILVAFTCCFQTIEVHQ